MKSLQTVHSGLALTAAYILAGLSVFACGYFGTIIGDGLEAFIFAVAFASLDVIKFTLPHWVDTFVVRRHFGWAGVATLLFVLFSLGSIICEIGVYKATVSHTSAPVLASQEAYGRDKQEKADLEGQIQKRNAVTLADARAAVLTLKQNRLFNQTMQCTDATLPESKVFCEAYFKADADLEKAKEVADLEEKLRTVKDRLAAADLSVQGVSVTPQADAIAAVVGIVGLTVDKGGIQNIIAILVAVLLEAAGVVALIVARARREEPEVKPAPQAVVEEAEVEVVPLKPAPACTCPIEAWSESRLRRVEGSHLEPAKLLADYNAWATRAGHQHTTQAMLGRRLVDMGFEKTKIDGRIRYVGLAIEEPKQLKVVKS